MIATTALNEAPHCARKNVGSSTSFAALPYSLFFCSVFLPPHRHAREGQDG
jgi:hypothetical protein